MGERRVTIITYDCPGCGASVKINPGNTSATCEYCGTHFAVTNETVPPRRVEPPRPNRVASNRAKALAIVIVVMVLMFSLVIVPVIFMSLVAASSTSNTTRVEAQKIEADPFKDIKVHFDGMEPFGTFKDVTNNSGIYGIKYVVDKRSNLSNGDVITITAEDLKGYEWTTSTYEYTVSGLSTIVRDIAQLSEADQELLFTEAKKEVEKHWEDNLTHSDYTMESLHVDIKPYKLYLNLNKDEEYIFFSSNNIVYPAFETTISVKGKTYTFYQYADIANVYKNPDGSMHGDFDRMSASNGYLYFNELGISDSFSIWGFDSVLKMESNMEDEHFDLIK